MRAAVSVVLAGFLVIVFVGLSQRSTAAELDLRSQALDQRSQALDQRRSEIDKTAEAVEARRAILDARSRDLDARESDVGARRTAADSSQRAADAAGDKLVRDRATFEAQRAAFNRDYCTVFVGGHDANTTFRGDGFVAACDELERWLQQNRMPTLQGDPAYGVLCRGSKAATLFEVRDTGGVFYGTRICDALIRWSQGATLATLPWPR